MAPTVTEHHTCPKCSSSQTRVIGRSLSPPALYIECSRCGYSTSVVPEKPAGMAEMNAERVEQIARRVMADLGTKATFVAVVKDDNAWTVAVRTDTRRVVRLLIETGTPGAMRAAIKDALQGV
jgi:hypothetical protein